MVGDTIDFSTVRAVGAAIRQGRPDEPERVHSTTDAIAATVLTGSRADERRGDSWEEYRRLYEEAIELERTMGRNALVVAMAHARASQMAARLKAK